MMIYVHLHFANNPDNYAAYLADSVIVDVLGRSSVPLLSVISGFLMISFFAKGLFTQPQEIVGGGVAMDATQTGSCSRSGSGYEMLDQTGLFMLA